MWRRSGHRSLSAISSTAAHRLGAKRAQKLATSLRNHRAILRIGSLSAVADSKQTLPCPYLSAVVLAGLLLNSLRCRHILYAGE